MNELGDAVYPNTDHLRVAEKNTLLTKASC